MTRRPITKSVLESFMRRIGIIVRQPSVMYLTGGSTAILLGFREGTIDIDMAGDMDEIFSEIPRIKNEMDINIELAKPTDFVPGLPGESDRHLRIGAFGPVTFFHFDPYAQAFSKLVRAHGTDIEDVKALANRGLVDPDALFEMVKRISDRDFSRHTRLNRASVEGAVEDFARFWRGNRSPSPQKS